MDYFFVGKKIRTKIINSIGLLCLAFSASSLAQVIAVQPNTIISISKTYQNVTLDMSKGSFILTKGAALILRDSTIKGDLSKNNPFLFNVENGSLRFQNVNMQVHAQNITPHPLSQSLYHVIKVSMGNVIMGNSRFTIDKTFSAGLLITEPAMFPTTGFRISNNRFENFHGVLYLIGSDNALISNNTFFANSYGNLVSIGSHNSILDNTIYFSGNNRLGNSMDIINSEDVTISRNTLLTPTCHGIYVLSSNNVTIQDNRIEGGITYAMNILSSPEMMLKDKFYMSILPKDKINFHVSGNIVIRNNFMSQNRYGIAADGINGLVIENNYFVQKFNDAATRKFWTNNQTLLTDVSNLTWNNNLYKEAYSQEINGDNSKANEFVVFPQTGGVSL